MTRKVQYVATKIMYCTVKFLINVSNGDETSKKKLGVFETP